jgi:hypothetical protein
MNTLRISAWIGLAVATVIVALLAGIGVYFWRSRGASLDLLPNVSTVLSLVLLVFGAVIALRRGDSRFLIVAWAWRAGESVPSLFHHAQEPDRLRVWHDPHAQALVDQGWRISQNIAFVSAAINSAIALAGLALVLYRRKT